LEVLKTKESKDGEEKQNKELIPAMDDLWGVVISKVPKRMEALIDTR